MGPASWDRWKSFHGSVSRDILLASFKESNAWKLLLKHGFRFPGFLLVWWFSKISFFVIYHYLRVNDPVWLYLFTNGWFKHQLLSTVNPPVLLSGVFIYLGDQKPKAKFSKNVLKHRWWRPMEVSPWTSVSLLGWSHPPSYDRLIRPSNQALKQVLMIRSYDPFIIWWS